MNRKRQSKLINNPPFISENPVERISASGLPCFDSAVFNPRKDISTNKSAADAEKSYVIKTN